MDWILGGQVRKFPIHKVSLTVLEGRWLVDASQVLGSPQVAGLIVVPKGFGASAFRAVSIGNPAVATSLKQVMERSRRRGQQALSEVVLDTPRFSGYGLLALTAQELALVSGPRHAVHKVIARMPRSEIVFAGRLGHGFPNPTFPLAIVFKDGHAWYFEVQWNRWRAAKKILSPLKAEQEAARQS